MFALFDVCTHFFCTAVNCTQKENTERNDFTRNTDWLLYSYVVYIREKNIIKWQHRNGVGGEFYRMFSTSPLTHECFWHRMCEAKASAGEWGDIFLHRGWLQVWPTVTKEREMLIGNLWTVCCGFSWGNKSNVSETADWTSRLKWKHQVKISLNPWLFYFLACSLLASLQIQRCNVQYAVFGVSRLTSTLCTLLHCEYCAFKQCPEMLARLSGSELPVLHVEVETVTSWIEQQTGRHHCEGLAATTGHKFLPYHCIIKWLLGLVVLLALILWNFWSQSCDVDGALGRRRGVCLLSQTAFPAKEGKYNVPVWQEGHMYQWNPISSPAQMALFLFFVRDTENTLSWILVNWKQREENIFFWTTWSWN